MLGMSLRALVWSFIGRAGRKQSREDHARADARALFARPAALLADEPLTALDPERARETLDLLIAVAREEEVPAAFAGDYPSRAQAIRSGSYALVEGLDGLGPLRQFTLRATLWPTTPDKGAQGVVTLAGGEGGVLRILSTADGKAHVGGETTPAPSSVSQPVSRAETKRREGLGPPGRHR